MKKVIPVILWVLFFASVIWYSYYRANKYQKSVNKMGENIGKKIIINKDTLLIVNYNYQKREFTLSNGLLIDELLLKKQ